MNERPILDTSQLAAGVGAASVSKYVDRVLGQVSNCLPELILLYNGGDLTELADRCHKLKSSTRAIGAIRLADALADLEVCARGGQQPVARSIVDSLSALVAELAARASQVRA